MAMPNPDKIPLDRILKLVDLLSPADQEEFHRQLGAKALGKELRALAKEIDEQNKDFPPISEKEIAAEMKAGRNEG